MDATPCNVIYVDRSIRQDRVHRSRSSSSLHNRQFTDSAESSPAIWESQTLENNVNKLAAVFGDVHLCATGTACITRLFHLQDESMLDLTPTIVLIDTPPDERISSDVEDEAFSRPQSPRSKLHIEILEVPPSSPTEDVYGLQLLQRIVSEAHLRNLSKLVVPVPVISYPDSRANTSYGSVPPNWGPTDYQETQALSFQPDRPTSRTLLKKCLRLGATDVLLSPIRSQCTTSLEIHAYWAHKSAMRDQQALMEFRRGRKRSWVGISDDRPYAYLRESMVASLMRRICQMDDATELPVEAVRLSISARRKPVIAAAIGSWHFSAHDLNDDELVEASALMFKHALSVPELAPWRIPTDQLVCFLIACRAAYNSFVPYHNFRHVVDVLQATFNFLVNIGALPPYPPPSPQSKPCTPPPRYKSPLASLLHSFEALTLLITAIGHDVGHPGVNNGFLVELNTPLAQLYNDRSVLECFHCAAYSQILRRYWPATFANTKMRKLMISSILATDMGLHFDYMKKLGSIQDKLAENNTTDGWNGRMIEEQTSLACALLIKCADISNVARRNDTAVQWMHILSDEFSRQSSMEAQLDIKSSLMAQPTKDIVALFRSQLGFMNMFAIPLFQEVANVMPAMQYCVDELEINKALFERGIASELAKRTPEFDGGRDGTFSPRSMSVAVPIATPERKDALSNSNGTSMESMTQSRGTSSPRTPQYTSDSDGPMPGRPQLVDLGAMYRQTSGVDSQFNSVADFAASDPFNLHGSRSFTPTKQRASETTDGSTSVPSGIDWASQATSATTGKMPLSPSTQGTSVSRDSMDRPSSVPAVSSSTHEPDSLIKNMSHSLGTLPMPGEEDMSVSPGGPANGNAGNKSPPEGRGLKKKTSRFRMNALTFFRRHLSPGPPLPALPAPPPHAENPNSGM